MFDPIYPFKKQFIEHFEVEALLQPVFLKGVYVYHDKPILDIRQYREDALAKIWSQVKRLENPQTYYVDYSLKLYELKNSLIEKFRK